MDIMQFINPELLALIPLLYFIGSALKKMQSISDNYIPLILGISGMGLALLWVLGTAQEPLGLQAMLLAAFTAAVQGWLCAGMSVYANQIIRQNEKRKEDM